MTEGLCFSGCVMRCVHFRVRSCCVVAEGLGFSLTSPTDAKIPRRIGCEPGRRTSSASDGATELLGDFEGHGGPAGSDHESEREAGGIIHIGRVDVTDDDVRVAGATHEARGLTVSTRVQDAPFCPEIERQKWGCV